MTTSKHGIYIFNKWDNDGLNAIASEVSQSVSQVRTSITISLFPSKVQ